MLKRQYDINHKDGECGQHTKWRKEEEKKVERIKEKPGRVGMKRGAGGRSFGVSDRSQKPTIQAYISFALLATLLVIIYFIAR